MKPIRILFTFAMTLGLCTSFAFFARAQQPEPLTAERTPEIWENKLISIEASDTTAKKVFTDLAAQTQMGLAVTASAEDLQQPLTLMISNRPAKEVLEIIKTGLPNLDITVKGDILLVSSRSASFAKAEKASEKNTNDTLDNEAVSKGRDRRSKWRDAFDNRNWKKKDLVKFGSAVEVPADEQFHSAVSIGGDTTVSGIIDKDAVSIGGTLTIKSGAVVKGTAVSVGGSVNIEPGAVVQDDAVSVGGTLNIADTATVGGSRVNIGIPMPSMSGAAGAIGGMLVLNIVATIVRSILLLALAILLIFLVPKRVDKVADYMVNKPGVSALSGFLILLAIIPVFVVLAVTIIGIPLIPVAAVLLAAMAVLGLTSAILLLGRKIPLFGRNKSPIAALLVGFLAFLVINLVPIIGCLFFMILFLLGLGSAFQSRFGSRSIPSSDISEPTQV